MIPPRGHGVAPRVTEASQRSLRVRLVFFVVLCVESPYPAAAVFSGYFYLSWKYQPPQVQEGFPDEKCNSREARREAPLLLVPRN